MFLADLFTIVKTRKEPGWVNQMWYTVEYCSAIKINKHRYMQQNRQA